MNKKKICFSITNIALITSIIMTTGCISSGDVITPPGIPCDIAGVSANDTLIWNDTRNLFEPGEGGLGGGGTTYYADNTTLNLTGSVFSINNNIWGENLSWDGTYVNATGGSAYTAGTGLNLTGTAFSINNTIWGENLSWDGTYVNASGGGGAASVGGLYGITERTLTGNIILVPNVDTIYQQLITGSSDRTVTLDTGNATKGDRFEMRNLGTWNVGWYLNVYGSGVQIGRIGTGAYGKFIYNGTKWISYSIDGADVYSHDKNIAIGYNAQAHNSGTAVGYEARGYYEGAALGRYAIGTNYGAAVGYYSDAGGYGVSIGQGSSGANYGLALGYHTDTHDLRYSASLGYQSQNYRVSEISHNINGADADQENNIVIGGWCGDTTNAVPTELYAGGYGTSRFLIYARSSLSFNIIVTASNYSTSEVAKYSFDGLIKRDGSSNTVLSYLTKNTDYEDDATWDVNVTADDTNEALIITVTGDAANTVQWAARLDGVETHF